MSRIILKPVITEKASFESEMNNKFTFIVDRNANKLQIKEAVESMYGVTVESVKTMNLGGGKDAIKYTNKGISEQRNSVVKKAIIAVAEGETIDLYSNI
tara:strand:- start:149 stop:445 length:297 start_codon:yes stop_codon:yes gene_type:complete